MKIEGTTVTPSHIGCAVEMVGTRRTGFISGIGDRYVHVRPVGSDHSAWCPPDGLRWLVPQVAADLERGKP